jgi:hypothetical protein
VMRVQVQCPCTPQSIRPAPIMLWIYCWQMMPLPHRQDQKRTKKDHAWWGVISGRRTLGP